MWNDEEIDRLRTAVERMTPADRDRLTWESAGEYVPADTLYMAQWSGLSERRRGTPYEALRVLHMIRPGATPR